MLPVFEVVVMTAVGSGALSVAAEGGTEAETCTSSVKSSGPQTLLSLDLPALRLKPDTGGAEAGGSGTGREPVGGDR